MLVLDTSESGALPDTLTKIKSMAKRNEIKMTCDRCGKSAPVDKEQSTKQWIVYKSGSCSCGGRYRFDI
jgi:hypothetical protein